jgi:hypothetical protein
MITSDLALQIAWRLYGTPYIWGGIRPMTGLDCSGFVQVVFSEIGLMPYPILNDMTAAGMWDKYKDKVVGSPAPGCLVFYGDPITHVMICLDHAFCIGAAGGDRDTRTVEKAQEKDARVKVRPINYRPDVKGFINLFQ